MEQSTPRVNSSLLSLYVGRTVRLVGKVLVMSEGTRQATMEASDHGHVTIHLTPVRDSDNVKLMSERVGRWLVGLGCL